MLPVERNLDVAISGREVVNDVLNPFEIWDGVIFLENIPQHGVDTTVVVAVGLDGHDSVQAKLVLLSIDSVLRWSMEMELGSLIRSGVVVVGTSGSHFERIRGVLEAQLDSSGTLNQLGLLLTTWDVNLVLVG